MLSVICFGKQQAITKPEVTDPTVVDAPAVDRIKAFWNHHLEEKAYGDIEENTVYFLEVPENFQTIGKQLYIKGRLDVEAITSDRKVKVWVPKHIACCHCHPEKETR